MEWSRGDPRGQFTMTNQNNNNANNGQLYVNSRQLQRLQLMWESLLIGERGPGDTAITFLLLFCWNPCYAVIITCHNKHCSPTKNFIVLYIICNRNELNISVIDISNKFACNLDKLYSLFSSTDCGSFVMQTNNWNFQTEYLHSCIGVSYTISHFLQGWSTVIAKHLHTYWIGSTNYNYLNPHWWYNHPSFMLWVSRTIPIPNHLWICIQSPGEISGGGVQKALVSL